MTHDTIMLVVMSFLLIFIAFRELVAYAERKELLNRIMAKNYLEFSDEELRYLKAKHPPKKEVIESIEL